MKPVVMAEIDSPVGVLVAGTTDDGLCLLEFRDREILEAQVAKVRARVGPTEAGSHRYLEQVTAELSEYFDGVRREFTIPLVYPGTPFQLRVWNALRLIPYGETISYEELARRVGSPSGQRAAGHANGQNPLAIIIPCHRVVNKGGKLGGYGGGLWRKRLLLELERTLEPDLFSRGGTPRAANATSGLVERDGIQSTTSVSA
jgi:AraC family transcriptional regulator, regulatory protein of adaptative response / methylated-DNA-[protein]-cysteine methyltransferase